ncbi:MAG: hypothetical protein CMM16_03825 [Rhodospirillaceae bacterium]|nr:hypothetical protein [Rhodospirillaceae bacterium]
MISWDVVATPKSRMRLKVANFGFVRLHSAGAFRNHRIAPDTLQINVLQAFAHPAGNFIHL